MPWSIKKYDDSIVTHATTGTRIQFRTKEDAEAFIQKNFVTPNWYKPVSEAGDWNNTVEEAVHENPTAEEEATPDQNEIDMAKEMKDRLR